MRILLAEDDPRVAQMVASALGREGYTVDVAADGETALERVATTTYDLLVLDIMLPRMDGIDVCRTVRARGTKAPVLMLSARGLVEERVEGLDAGADDYLTKPFNMMELSARVRALLRRHGSSTLVPLTVDDLWLDPVTRTVKRGDRAIELTSKEFDLLEFLMRHTGQTLTRQMIFERVWSMHWTRLTNVIDVFVNHLRKKLEAHGEPRLIHTVRGAGYVMRSAGAVP